MTDFRRPDLDLWEEEDDGEDGRPTIVSERPAPVLLSKPTKAADRTIPFGTIQVERKTPEVQRSTLVQRLIEQGALEQDVPARDSEEVLRDSEIDLLKLPPEPEVVVEIEANARAPSASAGSAPRAIEGLESEPATEDQVPTVSVKRPLPPVPMELEQEIRADKAAAAERAPSFAEREITERISIPTGMVGSIAPATRTFRPEARERKGMKAWQTALAALVLLGGGMSIAKFRAAQQRAPVALSSQPQATPDLLPAAASLSAAPTPAEPVPAAVEPAPTPADQAPPRPELAPAAPPAVEAPVLPKREAPDSESRTRWVRERRAIASAEQSPATERTPEPIVKAKPEPASSPALPAVPTREQVASSLDAVRPELSKCVGERHGRAEVAVTVRPAGFVSYAVVSGDYAGTTEGSCIARALRGAKFPAFSQPVLRVTYPFQL